MLGQDYTENELGLSTNYFEEYPWIGEPDKRVGENTSNDKDPYFNKLGGNPAWIGTEELEIMELYGRQSNDVSSLVPQIPTKSLKCGNCSAQMSLVAQCYVPLGPYDRFLYVFGCNNGECSEKPNAWACFRTQFRVDSIKAEQQKNKPKPSSSTTTEEKSEEKTENTSTQTEKAANDWNQTVDDKELLDLLSGQQAQVKKFAEGGKKKKKKNKVSLEVSEGNLPCFGLDIYEEPEEEAFPEDSYEMNLYKQFQGQGTTEESEAFDSKEAEAFAKKFMSERIQGVTFKEGESSEGDKTAEGDDNDDEGEDPQEGIPESQKISQAFVHFQTILSKCPLQSIRWQFGGKPLWTSDDPEDLPSKFASLKKSLLEKKKENDAFKNTDDSDEEEEFDVEPNPSDYVPKCDKCGSKRVFELEIMPTVIYQLKADDHIRSDVKEGMQFGCVCIFTCSNPGCDGYTEQERKQFNDSTPKLKYVKEHIHVQPGL